MAKQLHGTLVASTVASHDLDAAVRYIRVINRSGSAAIYFRTDGTNPVVDADDNFVVPAVAGASYEVPAPAADGVNTIKLISSGTPTYSLIGR